MSRKTSKKDAPSQSMSRPRRITMEHMTPALLEEMQARMELLEQGAEDARLYENVRLEEEEGRNRGSVDTGELKDVGMLNRLAIQRYMETELRKFHHVFAEMPEIYRSKGYRAAVYWVVTEVVPALEVLDIAPNRTQSQVLMDHRIYMHLNYRTGMLEILLSDTDAGFDARLALLEVIDRIIVQPALRWLAGKSTETGAGLAPVH